MVGVVIVFALLLVACVYLVGTYNGLVNLRESVKVAWSNIDENFRHLQTRITGLEESIADRRELYNDEVNLTNIRIKSFPDVLIAGMFDFPAAHLLEFTRDEKCDVNVGALFAK